MKFDSFLGNDKLKEDLSVLFASGRLPHAILLEGEEGVGKHTLARIIAKALVCRGDDKPCDECAQCKKASQNIHPDIFDYVPEGGTRSFHIKTVRQVINDVSMQPNEAPYKVYILCNAHLMGAPAQNALLKVLEEPPSYAIFIMTVQSKSQMLNTVLSRSVVFSVDGVNSSDAVELITQRLDNVSYDDAQNALIAFGSNIGKAMQSLNDGKAGELVLLCKDICSGIVADNEYELLKTCVVFQKDRQYIISASEMLKMIFRDALLISQGVKTISGSEDSARLLSRKLTSAKLLALIDTIDEIKRQTIMNGNNALIITKFCYALRRAAGK